MNQVLSIAGSDSCGGAGLQADLKTFTTLGVDGATVVTAVTAQNTAGVRAVEVMSAAFVNAQLDAVFEEMDIRATKLGMLANAAIVEAVASHLQRRKVRQVIVDPVLIATSGARLLDAAALRLLRSQLLPLADCLTPNLAEAAALLDRPCAEDEAGMVAQGRALLALGPRTVLMKGGHAALSQATDLLVSAHGVQRFQAAWVNTDHVHGTGCMLSAGIAAGVALGLPLADAVQRAKTHVGSVLASRRDRLPAAQAPGRAAAGGNAQLMGA